jgi:hypothetical protein
VEEGLTSGSKPIKDYLEAKNHAEAFDYVGLRHIDSML